MAFSVGALREVFSRKNMCLRWAATENMIAGALTKVVDTRHLRDTTRRGIWPIASDATRVAENVSSDDLE